MATYLKSISGCYGYVQLDEQERECFYWSKILTSE